MKQFSLVSGENTGHAKMQVLVPVLPLCGMTLYDFSPEGADTNSYWSTVPISHFSCRAKCLDTVMGSEMPLRNLRNSCKFQ